MQLLSIHACNYLPIGLDTLLGLFAAHLLLY